MKRILLFATLFLLFFFCAPASADMSDNLAKAGPYHGGLSTTYSTGGGIAYAQNPGVYYLCAGQAAKFMQTGDVTCVKFNAQNTNTVTDMRIQIWRWNSASDRWNLKSTSANLEPTLVDGLNVINLTAAPISVIEGDSFGVKLTGTGGAQYPVLSLNSSSIAYQANIRYGIYNIGTVEFNWWTPTYTGGYNGVLAMEFFMAPPDTVWHGDSIMSWQDAFTDQPVGGVRDDYTHSAPYYFKQLSGKTYQNTGIATEAYPALSNRFYRDVILKHPKAAIIEGGINSIASGGMSASTTFSYLLSEINMCKSAGITPVVMLLYPYNGLTQAQVIQYNLYNQMILDYAATTGGICTVDVRDAIGAPSGNAWAMDAMYTLDGLHPNAAGNAVVAQSVYDALRSYANSSAATGSDLINAPYGTSTILSVATSNQLIGSVTWYVDGVAVGETSSAFSYTGSSPGVHNITAVTVFQDGSRAAPSIFLVSLNRGRATTATTKLDVSHFAATKESVIDMNATLFFENIPYPWTDIIGKTFFLVIFAIPFVFIRINTGKLEMPLILFLICGWMAIGFVPFEWHYMIWIVFSMAIMAVLYGMIKERG